jgi:hypothetical protein
VVICCLWFLLSVVGITEKKTAQLLDKIAQLAGSRRWDVLK